MKHSATRHLVREEYFVHDYPTLSTARYSFMQLSEIVQDATWQYLSSERGFSPSKVSYSSRCTSHPSFVEIRNIILCAVENPSHPAVGSTPWGQDSRRWAVICASCDSNFKG